MPLSFVATFFVAAIALVTDLRQRRIPNWLTLPAFAVMVVLHLDKPLLALLSAVIATLPFAVVYWRGGVGGGDVKLAAVLGLGLGDLDAVMRWLIVTTLAGVVHALVLAARHGRLRQTLSRTFARGPAKDADPLSIPYAPAMFVGIVYAALSSLR